MQGSYRETVITDMRKQFTDILFGLLREARDVELFFFFICTKIYDTLTKAVCLLHVEPGGINLIPVFFDAVK